MTQLEFIQQISGYCKKYAKKYGFKVVSPAIAQACLESAYGTSYKAQHNNFFGLKYRPNRVTCNNGTFIDGGSQQNKDGSYSPITKEWYHFDTMQAGVEGYYQFISTNNYIKVKTAATALSYLQQIKAAGYATSINYVNNVYSVVQKWNLEQYDNDMTPIENTVNINYTNSPKVVYTRISPNRTSPRNRAIDTITIHCMAGNLTIETCGNVFAPPERQASSNYGIGTDGRIGMYVEEKDRSWCSSNAENDHRAITIQVANNSLAPHYTVSDMAMDSLIKLCADICIRNGKNKMVWIADKDFALSRVAAPNEMRMTLHKWFKNKLCPGPYLESKMGYIAEEVNKLLGTGQPVTPTPATPINNKDIKYSVQIGAYAQQNNANKIANIMKNVGYKNVNIIFVQNLYKVQIGLEDDINKATKLMNELKTKGYNGIIVAVDAAALNFKPYLVRINTASLNYREGPGTNYLIKGQVKRGEVYTIVCEENGFGQLKSGAGWISLNYVKKV